jgi:hypothetical protein
MSTANQTFVLEETARESIAQELEHFSSASARFLEAWKRGVRLAGPQFFGTRSTHADLDHAESKWDLCPKMALIDRAIGVMSSGEKVFLAALTSFYNAEDGGELLKRAHVQGLADLGGLDLERRAVIAALILNYTGW